MHDKGQESSLLTTKWQPWHRVGFSLMGKPLVWGTNHYGAKASGGYVLLGIRKSLQARYLWF